MLSYNTILSFESDIYKLLYEESKQRRTQINSKLAPTITIITGELGALVWTIFRIGKDIATFNNAVMKQHIIPIILIVLSVVLICISIAYLSKCLTNYKFTYLNPIKISECINDNRTYLKYYSEKDIVNNIQTNIVDEYKKMCIENWEITNKHCGYFRLCYIYLIGTLVSLVVNFMFVLVL